MTVMGVGSSRDEHTAANGVRVAYTGASPVPPWIVERRRLVAEARTFAKNVESRAARSPQRIAAFIRELADALEADCG